MKAYHNIPAEIQSYHQWIVWRYEYPVGDKPTKVPYDPRTGFRADVNKPETWVSFDEACAAVHAGLGYDGIGFVFTNNDPFCGIDLDEVPEDDGSAFARQQRVYEYLNSYSELSPSGNGLHIIVKASVPHGRKRSSIEVYSNQRYFTFTGHVYRNMPILDRQQETTTIWQEMGEGARASHYEGEAFARESDEAIYNKAASAKNGELFVRLWSGDWSGYPPNRAGDASSEADFALVDIIAYYTKNKAQIVRMFLSSAMAREKYHQRPRLVTYMVDKSFDRMLPDVDFSAVIDKVNAALASQQPTHIANSGTGTATFASPAGSGVNDLSTQPPGTPSEYDGFNLDLWKTAPPGLVGGIARFIYDQAPRPVYEIALAGAIGLFAGIVGRGYLASGTGLNHYVMLLAYTGSGKEAIASGADKLIDALAQKLPFARNYLGPTEIVSGQALIKFLSEADNPCFVSITGEIGLRMQRMSSPNANSSETTLKSLLLDLFGKSGANQSIKPWIYSDKKNNTKEVHSPSFSMLGESVPDEFYKAFDEDAVKGGLLPRFLMIEYDGIRVPLNEQHHYATVPTWLVEQMDELILSMMTRLQAGDRLFCNPDPNAAHKLALLNTYCDDKINSSRQDALKQLWNRVHLKVYKLAALIAVGVNPYNPTISIEMVDWATSLVMSDTIRLTGRFERGEMGTDNTGAQQVEDARQMIRQYYSRPYHELASYQVKERLHRFRVISRSYLTTRLKSMASFRKTNGNTLQAIDNVIKVLLANGWITEIPKQQMEKEYGTTTTAYVCDDFQWLDL